MPAGWSRTHPSRASFIAAPESDMRDYGTGVQIDWDNVSAALADATTGKKVIPAGTRLGWSGAVEGLAIPRVEGTPAQGILKTPAVEDDLASPGGGMYGMYTGGPVWENLLPGAAGTPMLIEPDEKAGLVTAGCTFYYQQYGDTP
jgi:hypothetical protein